MTAIVGNTLLLCALKKEMLLHKPSKALLRNQVVGDLCVGHVQFVSVAYWSYIVHEQWQKMSHSLFDPWRRSYHSGFFVPVDIDRPKRGQTLSSIVGT